MQPILYPTVPKDKARLRITVTPKHTKEDIDYLVHAISEVIRLNNKDIVIEKSNQTIEAIAI